MRWFEKFIGCAFTIWVQGKPEEYIFGGTCDNPATKSGKPLQYEFEAEGKPQVLLSYKEARAAMGAMIDKYKNDWEKKYLQREASTASAGISPDYPQEDMRKFKRYKRNNTYYGG